LELAAVLGEGLRVEVCLETMDETEVDSGPESPSGWARESAWGSVVAVVDLGSSVAGL